MTTTSLAAYWRQREAEQMAEARVRYGPQWKGPVSPVAEADQGDVDGEGDQGHVHGPQNDQVLDPALFTDSKGRVVPARLAESVRLAGHVRTAIDGRLWRYVGGVYRPDGDLYARTMVRMALGDDFRRRHGDEVGAYLRAFEATVTGEPNLRYLNVTNGLLDLRSMELRPHDPEVITTIQLPVAWNPEATCPTVDTYLRSALPADAIDFAYEVIGYAMYAGNPYRKAVLFLGPGGNGKSTFLHLVSQLLGPTNVSNVALQALGENRFAAALLHGRLANICGDLDARAIKRTDLFKQLTGGDTITGEHKNRDPFTFTSYALPVFSANEAPISSDQTQAWFDRWLIVPMTTRFEGTTQDDPHLRDKLTKQAELEGLLVRSVAGLRTLMGRGRFDQPATVAKAGERYRESLDTARGFIADECTIADEAWIPRSGLYKAYRDWCRDSGRMPIGADRFNEHVQTARPAEISLATRRGIRGWRGIGLARDAQ